jgi:error-prone DNA polymerase
MYPRRLLLSEARRLGVELLPIDVNCSTDEYRVETIPFANTGTENIGAEKTGVRMSLTEVQGISEAEIERIIAEQPFMDVSDFYLRAKPSRRTMERLALIGALDAVAGITAGEVFTRGDVMARVRQLNAIKKRPTPREDQPTLDFSMLNFGNLEQLPTGNAEMSITERVQYELDILHLDVSQHVLEQYRPMLDEMGVINSNELVGLRNKSDVLVAGVRVATQTPPMRSGKRVVFITLDDGTGCSDATFFDEAQSRCSHILFNTRLVIISGKTRRTGVRGVSIMAENAWDLKELWNQWLIAVEDRKQTQDLYV